MADYSVEKLENLKRALSDVYQGSMLTPNKDTSPSNRMDNFKTALSDVYQGDMLTPMKQVPAPIPAPEAPIHPEQGSFLSMMLNRPNRISGEIPQEEPKVAGAEIGAEAGGQQKALASIAPLKKPEPKSIVKDLIKPKESDQLSPEEEKALDSYKPSLASDENLRKAQEGSREAQLIAGLGKSLNLLGAGLSQSDVTAAQNAPFEEIEKQGKGIESDYLKRIEMEKLDPNSGLSQGIREALKNSFNINVPENIAAADVEKIAPYFVKAHETRAAKELGIQQGKEKLAQSAEEKEKDRQLRRELFGMNAENKLATREEKKTEGKEKQQNQALQQTQTFLESSRNLPDVRQALMDNYNIKKAEGILKGKDLNSLSNQEVGLLVSELSKIARGGVPTQDELKAISPNTLAEKLSKYYSNLINKPTPANAGAFLKQYQNYLKELKSNAQDTISKKVKRVIETRKDELGEKHYNTLQEQYSDLLNPGQEESNQMSKEDKEAIDWANQNPNDPRAQRILQLHGMS